MFERCGDGDMAFATEEDLKMPRGNRVSWRAGYDVVRNGFERRSIGSFGGLGRERRDVHPGYWESSVPCDSCSFIREQSCNRNASLSIRLMLLKAFVLVFECVCQEFIYLGRAGGGSLEPDMFEPWVVWLLIMRHQISVQGYKIVSVICCADAL